ncbi:hypothetical protein KFE25_004642 [Diacronema lutheri]|uniref:Uncharacterized protein n=1 Tax=Diacronema lutheri TaxID=2081491 RepID=A0A8J6C973_DIALT|nr:hypothetical protein KFE25_004642 [Diacronema lutheri]
MPAASWALALVHVLYVLLAWVATAQRALLRLVRRSQRAPLPPRCPEHVWLLLRSAPVAPSPRAPGLAALPPRSSPSPSASPSSSAPSSSRALSTLGLPCRPARPCAARAPDLVALARLSACLAQAGARVVTICDEGGGFDGACGCGDTDGCAGELLGEEAARDLGRLVAAALGDERDYASGGARVLGGVTGAERGARRRLGGYVVGALASAARARGTARSPQSVAAPTPAARGRFVSAWVDDRVRGAPRAVERVAAHARDGGRSAGGRGHAGTADAIALAPSVRATPGAGVDGAAQPAADGGSGHGAAPSPAGLALRGGGGGAAVQVCGQGEAHGEGGARWRGESAAMRHARAVADGGHFAGAGAGAGAGDGDGDGDDDGTDRCGGALRAGELRLVLLSAHSAKADVVRAVRALCALEAERGAPAAVALAAGADDSTSPALSLRELEGRLSPVFCAPAAPALLLSFPPESVPDFPPKGGAGAGSAGAADGVGRGGRGPARRALAWAARAVLPQPLLELRGLHPFHMALTELQQMPRPPSRTSATDLGDALCRFASVTQRHGA